MPARRKRAAGGRRACARQRPPRRGGRCPRCRQGRLAYDGLVQLSCPRCGYVADAGGFT